MIEDGAKPLPFWAAFFSSALVKAWVRSPLVFSSFFEVMFVSSGFRLDEGCLSFWSLFSSSGSEDEAVDALLRRLGQFRRELRGMDGGNRHSDGTFFKHRFRICVSFLI